MAGVSTSQHPVAQPRKRRRVACVLGTRPELIKMAPVVHALDADPGLEPLLVNTGQHRELLAPTLELFGLEPVASLELMRSEQRLAGFLGRCVEALDLALQALQPAAIVAQGDTSTVLAAALVAFYQRLPFFHVEAGLRTHDWDNPWPEEMNRTIASRFTALHFAPTQSARDNLVAEGIAEDAIEITGNTVIDALLMVRDMRIPHGLALTPGRRLILVTSHRRESFGAPMRSTMRALRRIARRWPDVEIVYPAHPNPEVRRAIDETIGDEPSIRIVEPLSYGPFVSLLDAATIVLTDSGGIQEEAPALGKPVLVLREETERPEAVEVNVARLVGTDEERVVSEVARLLDDPAWYGAMARGASPYGDGHAAGRIVRSIERYLETAPDPRHAR